MKNNVKAIPDGFHTLTPYLSVKNAVKALDFYVKAFGAKEEYRMDMPDGTIGHAELTIGDSKIMLSDENEQWGNRSPQSIGGTPVTLCLYVNNVDEVYANALKAGAKAKSGMEVKDQFYGDRSGTVIDPFGHEWTIMTHIEDVSPEEMQSRTEAMFQNAK